MFAGVFLQAPALLGAGVWVCCDTIGGLGVPSIGHIPLHTGVDNGSFRLFPFPSQPWGCGP